MNNRNGLEIAIIGMSCRFPSANNVEDFWGLLEAGKEGFIRLSDEELRAAGVPEDKLSQKNYVKKVGVIHRKKFFDAELFGYNAREAQFIDPQFGVFHEVVWEALESAGYCGEKYDGDIGIYAGASGNSRWLGKIMSTGQTMADGYAISSLTEAGYLCSRVSHKLNLTGPAISNNATCATSLVNIHLACQGLNTGECDIAIAGGVRIPTLENQGYLYQEDMIMSPDGTCRPFDADAAGTAQGEGCAVIVLKRLEDAETDNDNILAVIKGSAINNDGKFKNGFTAPSVEGQFEVISNAIARAEIEPGSIQYIEAHGTATKLGDPIEIAALKRAFATASDKQIAIGSVKSNIGHLGEPAGVAGLIKTVLAMKHKKIPASLNYQIANPLLQLEVSPFFVNSKITDWHTETGDPRRAGVSSFGLGGTNAHVVLEEYVSSVDRTDNGKEHVLSLSANNPTSLTKIKQALFEFCSKNPEASVADVCYTMHMGRRDLPYRSSFVVSSLDDMAEQLAVKSDVPYLNHVTRLAPAKVCMIFPGQGMQYVNMGAGLYQSEPVFKRFLDQGFELAKQITNNNFKEVLYPSTGTVNTALVDTKFVQPLLFIYEYALAATLQHCGVKADVFIGHSIGEYVAACLSGVFSYEDALAIVIQRGLLVASLPSGAMLAVPCSESQVKALLDDDGMVGVSIAAINAPERTVLSGDNDAIRKAKDKLQLAGVEGQLLHTSHAFHSHHLDAVLGDFSAFLSTKTFNKPKSPFFSNVTGEWISDNQACSPEYWCQQLRGTVKFSECVQNLLKNDEYVLLEVGPGNVLSGFARQIESNGKLIACIQTAANARNHRQEQDRSTLLAGLGKLWDFGVKLDWMALYGEDRHKRVSLPTYPFLETCFYPKHFLVANAFAAACASNDTKVCDVETVVQNNIETIQGATELPNAQAKLLAIWNKYIGVEDIKVDQDLFSFGVDSLMLIRVISEIRETFNIEISLERIFALKTIVEQAAEIENNPDNHAGLPLLPKIMANTSQETQFLSTSQQRLWMISQLDEGSTAYNNAFCALVKGICVDTLKRTVEKVLDRHSILRTIYTLENGLPMQKVINDFDIEIPIIDITDVEEGQRFDVARKIHEKELITPISLEDGPMIRVTLIKYSEESHLLLVTQHHICSDNWSLNILIKELGGIYASLMNGQDVPFSPLPMQYIDYAVWQHQWLQDGGLEQQKQFWKNKLSGAPEVHNFPTDYPRPKYQSYKGSQLYTRIDRDVVDGLNLLGQQYDATLFMIMQAAFSVLVGRYSNEDDIVIGFPVANRVHKEVEPLIGFFVNTLALRSDLAGNPEFTQHLANVKSNLLECYANAHLPFEILVEQLNPGRSLSYEPIVQIQLVILDQSQEHGSQISEIENVEPGTFTLVEMVAPFSKYDLTLYFRVTDKGMFCSWEYTTDLFEADTVKRIASNFETLLRGIIAQPKLPIRKLPLFSDEEKTLQFKDWHQADMSSFSHHLYKDLNEHYSRKSSHESSEGDIKFSLFYFASDVGDRAEGKYDLLMNGAKFADENGFDSIWTPERHFDSFGGLYPNPAITATAIAAVTKNVKIRSGSCVLPLHNPIRVAEDWSVIDNLSGGRVGIGFAAGWSSKDFVIAPGKFEQRKVEMNEGVNLVKKLWRGESVVLPINDNESAEISIRPRPLQAELPTWVTTTGNIEAFVHAGRTGENVLTHLLGQSVEALEEKVKAYRSAWNEAGHSGKGVVTLLAHAFIADTEQFIMEHVKEPFKKYLVISAGTPQAIARAVGGKGAESILSGENNSSDLDAITELAFNRYYNSNALLGTVEKCTPIVEKIKTAGVDEIACLIDFGVDEQLVMDNLGNLNKLRARFECSKAPALVDPKTLPSPSEFVARNGAGFAGYCLHQIFEKTAETYPDNIALQLGQENMSYRELNQRANQLARHIRAIAEFQDEEVVAICLDRSMEMYVAILAVLKAGGAYVPLEPSIPLQRKKHIMNETGASIVLIRQQDQVILPTELETIVAVDDHRVFGHYTEENLNLDIDSSRLSHIIYTSGSTGKPKGIMIEHRNVTRLFDACPDYMVRSIKDVGCTFHSYAFDVSVWEMWASLLYGARLVVIERIMLDDMQSLYGLLVDEKVTQISMTPSAFNALQTFIPIKEHKLSLNNVLFAGEALKPKMLKEWFEENTPNRPRFINLWGPAEATVYASAREINIYDVKTGRSNIGSSFADIGLCVLNDQLQPQPVGVAGEVYVGGLGVSRGYINNKELTEENFIANPLIKGKDDLWYRTGDICRWSADGSLQFLERKDNQVKLRGFRIELSEIDVCLMSNKSVKEAVVLAVGEDINQHLAAYIVLEDGGAGKAAIAEIKESLMNQLPAYMVPDVYVVIDAIPLNNSGKLDRKALLALSYERHGEEFVAPRTDIESAVEKIWCETLGLEKVSVTANFFSVGGQSLNAIRMINMLSKLFNIKIQTKIIFQYSTIETLAVQINSILLLNQQANTISMFEDIDVVEVDI